MFVLPVSTALHRRAMPRPVPAFAARAGACGVVAAEDKPSRQPRLDVIESDAAYSVVFDMPGVTKEQVEVTVEGQRVKVATLSAAAAAEPAAADAKARMLYRERGTAPYARTVVLPDEVDNAASQARFENGVLTLTLAKRSAARATQIRVS